MSTNRYQSYLNQFTVNDLNKYLNANLNTKCKSSKKSDIINTIKQCSRYDASTRTIYSNDNIQLPILQKTVSPKKMRELQELNKFISYSNFKFDTNVNLIDLSRYRIKE